MIVTTQVASVGHLTDSELDLPSMQPEEGSQLIRNFLRRGSSEVDAASRLSEELGGLPLAIAHFAGYVAHSQCSISYILDSLKERKISRKIWTTSTSVYGGSFDLTLETVWDLSFRRLSNDARHILDILAFLDADSVPVVMFTGPNEDLSREAEPSDWVYWEAFRY
jgi:hypothetical protein